MSKDDLVYLSMKNIAEPWKFFKANEHGVFCEVKGTWENFFKIDKVKKQFSIREAIEETLSLQSAQFKNRNIVVEISGEDVVIEGFRGEFQQVILNIINPNC